MSLLTKLQIVLSDLIEGFEENCKLSAHYLKVKRTEGATFSKCLGG
jgi:hypothetical protein